MAASSPEQDATGAGPRRSRKQGAKVEPRETGQRGGRTDRRFTGDPTRARILHAALTAFGVAGFHGTSTRQIAADAGLSPAALYVHYRTKEEILFQIAADGHREALAIVIAAIEANPHPESRLRAVVRDFAEWHARRSTLARVVQYELAALTPEHTATIFELRRRTHDAVRSVLVDGRNDGSFAVSDPDIVTVGILSLGIDVARWYRPEGSWSPSYIAEHYAEIALGLVGSGPRPSS